MCFVLAVFGGFLFGRYYSEVRSTRRRVALRHFVRAYNG